MRICGIEIKGSDAVTVILDLQADEEPTLFVEKYPKKIPLENDESQDSVRSFCEAFSTFVESHAIESIMVKKRHKKGNFAGGAVSFKIEGLIQLCAGVPVELYSGATIAKSNKKNRYEVPKKLNKYQLQAYLTARCAAEKLLPAPDEQKQKAQVLARLTT